MTKRLEEIIEQLTPEQAARVEQYAEIVLDLAEPGRPDRGPGVTPYWTDGPRRATAEEVVEAQHEASRLMEEGALHGLEVAESGRK